MKNLLFVCIWLMALNASAQTVVSFKLSESGSFITDDGKDYIVVTIKEKNAHQIFQQLSVNVNALYNNPSKVMSVVDDASISIRAFDDRISYIKDLIQKFWLSGYYNLNFQIKDGRVRVSAPEIDEDMTRTANSAHEKDFSRMVKSWFKEGVLKDKFKEQAEYTESNMNSIINAILGTSKSKTEEDW